MENCRTQGNSAGDGGGAYLMNSSCIQNSLFSGNSATNNGGGVYVPEGTSLMGCVVSGNQAAVDGGGVYLTHSGTTYNSLIVQNQAGGKGGAIFANQGSKIFSNTIVDNQAPQGAGIWVDEGASILNSVVWGNDSTGIEFPESYFYHVQYSCADGGVTNGASGCITNEPCFTDPANGDYTLRSHSPCINGGTNDNVQTATDLAGYLRIMDGTVDMGAYEYLTPGSDPDGDGIPDNWEVRYFDSVMDCVSNACSDSDALNNWQEYIAGTDPTDGSSYFCITNCSVETDGYLIEWNPVSGRSYSIWAADSLTNSFTLLTNNLAYPVSSCAVEIDTTNRFFKLEVELED